MKMQDLNDLSYFAKVVEAGGFAAAGRTLGIPKSRLSRRIAELENRLGARLLQRSTRKLALTDVGERYLRHCQAMLLEAEQAEEAVASLSSEPRGRLRVSCPVSMAQVPPLPELISHFLAAHPCVQLEMLLSNRRIDLLEEGVDVALRVRDEGDEDPALISRRLRPAQAFLVAAPSLLQGRRIQTPDDLIGLPVLGALEADRKVHYRLLGTDGSKRHIALEARLGIEDFIVRKNAALAGLGITMLPQAYCEEELANGSLQRLLPDWSLPGGYLQAVYPHRRGMLPAVRAWIEYLTLFFKDDRLPPV
jgi:DNA-binding transcriptional LysR family regulator